MGKKLFRWGTLSVCSSLVCAGSLFAQSLNNYSITRTTGVVFTSIAGSGNSISSWRHNDASQMLDDNRSYAIPIGFDFWYNGVRYTTISVGINGIADFSSSTATGFTAGDYDSDNPSHNRFSNTTGYTAWNALALLYGDLTTQNQVDPLGSSFKYSTSGTAPNRIFTVEWINLSVWNQINTGTSWNFQLKLYENSGNIEFIYGDMISGAATLQYKIGINAASLAGGLSNAVLRIQQTANSTNFLPQRIPTTGCVTALPESNSRLTFTPNTPSAPTGLTFNNVTQVQMQLHWADNASNEVGYAVYNSTDGVEYNFVAQAAAGSTSYLATGLLPETMYYWKVYAVTEGRLSTSLEGSQTTNNAVNFVSARTGSWNTNSTWVGNAVPTANSNVTIANGHTVTINVSTITINDLTIGQGASGILQIGNNNNVRTLNVLGNVTVNSGAQFIANTGSTATHQLNISGNIRNDGTLNFATDADSRCGAVFVRAGDQSISGTGGTTNFYSMTLNMGTTNANILDITSSNFSTSANGFLTITNGTFKFSSPNAITPFSAAVTIPSTGGLWVNNASAQVTTAGGSLSIAGTLRVSDGTLTIGTAANQDLISSGGDVIIDGGMVHVAGSFQRTNNVTTTRLTMNGGTLRVAVIGSASTTLAPFTIDVSGSMFFVTGGKIVVVREGGTGANNLGYVNTGSTIYSVTGGALQIGDYSTPASQTMQINTNIPVFDFIDSSNATAQLSTNNLSVENNIWIASGTLNANNLNITLKKNWTNQGTFTPGTGTVSFQGSQNSTVSNPAGESFYNLAIEKQSAQTELNNSVTVNNNCTLTSGILAVQGQILTLNGPVAGSSGSLTSLPSGTVSYNQSLTGQTILAANYGNLILNAYSKTFPAGIVGVASLLTAVNPATAHTMTGNTIDFNGSGAQTIAATTPNFIYNNLVLSNGVSKIAGGSITVRSDLTIGSLIVFDGAASIITVNRNISNSGSITGSGAGSVLLAGGTSAHTISGNGSYRNMTLNDASGAVISGKTILHGVMNLASGIMSVNTDSDTLSISSSGSLSRTAGYITGNLQMYIPGGSSSKIFMLGTPVKYMPVRLEFNNVGTAGNLTIGRKAGQQHPKISDPSAVIDSTQDVNVYWKIIHDGIILSANYTAVFAFDSLSECIGGVSPSGSDFDASCWNGSAWSYHTAGVRTSDSTRLNGLSIIGDFVLGKSRSALIYTIQSGRWNDPAVWSGRIPTQFDTAKITSSHAVTLANNSTVAALIVDAGNIIRDSVYSLVILNKFILNGTWEGNGRIRFTTAGGTLTGMGSMTGSSVLEIAANNVTVQASSNLVLKTVSIFSNDTLRNDGILTIDSLAGGSAASLFINRPGSTLITNGSLLTTGSLDAGACPNTVIYNGVNTQIIKPVTYCNIVMNNNGSKIASSAFDTNNSLIINLGSNLTVNSGITVQIRGIMTTSGTLNNNGNVLISD